MHYFIAYIHPISDGNGRTARSIFYFKCLKNELRFVELLSISAYLKDRRQAYEGAFKMAIEHEGDLSFFVDFSLDSLLRALDEVPSST
jgi:Fic family protein